MCILQITTILLFVHLIYGTNPQFDRLRTFGTEPPPVAAAGYTQLGNKLYLTFGINELFFGNPNVFYNTAYAMDLQTYTWEFIDASTPPTPRAFHCSWSDGSKLYVWGGSQYGASGFFYYNDLYALDPVTKIWSNITQLGTVPSARASSSCVQDGDKVYLIGGAKVIITGNAATTVLDQRNDVFEFDIPTKTWTRLYENSATDGPIGRVGSAIGKRRNSLFYFGGEYIRTLPTGGISGVQTNDTWEFSLVTHKWTQLTFNGLIPPALADFAYTSITDRNIYVYGGDGEATAFCGGTFPTNTVDELWIFSMISKKWTVDTQDRFGAPDLKRSALVFVDDLGIGRTSEIYLTSGYSFKSSKCKPPVYNPYTFVRSV